MDSSFEMQLVFFPTVNHQIESVKCSKRFQLTTTSLVLLCILLFLFTSDHFTWPDLKSFSTVREPLCFKIYRTNTCVFLFPSSLDKKGQVWQGNKRWQTESICTKIWVPERVERERERARGEWTELLQKSSWCLIYGCVVMFHTVKTSQRRNIFSQAPHVCPPRGRTLICFCWSARLLDSLPCLEGEIYKVGKSPLGAKVLPDWWSLINNLIKPLSFSAATQRRSNIGRALLTYNWFTNSRSLNGGGIHVNIWFDHPKWQPV